MPQRYDCSFVRLAIAIALFGASLSIAGDVRAQACGDPIGCGDEALGPFEDCESDLQCDWDEVCQGCACVNAIGPAPVPSLNSPGLGILCVALLGLATRALRRSRRGSGAVGPLCLVMITAGMARGATLVELSDCANASCGIPSNAEATATCSGMGDCDEGTYSWVVPPDTSIQRCTATVVVNAQPAGSWNSDGLYSTQRIDNCGTGTGNCEAISAQVKLGETRNDTITASFEVSLSQTVKAELSNAMVGTIGTQASVGFKAGASASSSVEQSIEIMSTLTGVPCCGKKVGKFIIWKRDEPSSATANFSLEGLCTNDGVSCDGGIWHQMKTCDADSSLTSVNFEPSSSLKVCDETCSAEDLASCCESSATTSPASCMPGQPS